MAVYLSGSARPNVRIVDNGRGELPLPAFDQLHLPARSPDAVLHVPRVITDRDRIDRKALEQFIDSHPGLTPKEKSVCKESFLISAAFDTLASDFMKQTVRSLVQTIEHPRFQANSPAVQREFLLTALGIFWPGRERPFYPAPQAHGIVANVKDFLWPSNSDNSDWSPARPFSTLVSQETRHTSIELLAQLVRSPYFYELALRNSEAEQLRALNYFKGLTVAGQQNMVAKYHPSDNVPAAESPAGRKTQARTLRGEPESHPEDQAGRRAPSRTVRTEDVSIGRDPQTQDSLPGKRRSRTVSHSNATNGRISPSRTVPSD